MRSSRSLASTARVIRPTRPPPRPFLCAQCQSISLPSTSFGLVRHASNDSNDKNEKPSWRDKWAEKTRKRIWGTDNPPGQKDPYNRASPEELQRLREEAARAEEEEAQAKAEGRDVKDQEIREYVSKPEGEEMGVEGRAEPPSDYDPDEPMVAPVGEELVDLNYVEAQTWDGLPRVGGKYTEEAQIEEFLEDHPFNP